MAAVEQLDMGGRFVLALKTKRGSDGGAAPIPRSSTS